MQKGLPPYSWKIWTLLFVFLTPSLFLGLNKGLTVSFLTLLVGISRGSPAFINFSIEWHAILVIAVAHVYGIPSAIFLVWASLPLLPILAPIIGGVPNPVAVATTTEYLTILAIICGLVSTENLPLFAFATVVLLDNIFNNFVIKLRFLPHPFVQRLSMCVINTALNYFLIMYFLGHIMAFLP